MEFWFFTIKISTNISSIIFLPSSLHNTFLSLNKSSLSSCLKFISNSHGIFSQKKFLPRKYLSLFNPLNLLNPLVFMDYNLYCFQKIWPLINKKVENLIFKVFSSKKVPIELNITFLTLIPKIEHPEDIFQDRLISLCNTIYKIITKIIVNQLWQVLPVLKNPNKCSFIGRRRPSSNITVTK